MLILVTENEHPAGKGSCLDVLDRELGEISREIKEDDASQTSQMLQDADSQHQPIPTGIENEEYSVQSIGSLRQGPEASSSVAIVQHVRDLPHLGTAASDLIT